MKRFYGLTGTQLNIAVAIIAGIDFALFGYDQVKIAITISREQLLTDIRAFWVASSRWSPF